MNGIKYKHILTLSVVLVLLTGMFIVSGSAREKISQTGDIVYATAYGMFYTKGGDCTTHYAGQGPLLGTTIYDPLIDCDVDLTYLPALAKSWKVAKDWSYVDFDLREGIKFHNGATVTAEDVKYSLAKHMYKKSGWVLGHDFRRKVEGAEVLDTYKVRFNLKSPFPGLWKRLWWDMGIFPMKYREEIGDKAFADKPVGAGPFKWLDYKQDVYFKIEAVEKHYRQTPDFKTLKFIYVTEASTRLAMLKAGEADIIELSGRHIPVIKADSNLKLLQTKHVIGSVLAFADLPFPDEKSPFQDIRVREAASLAIDRKGICLKILFEGSEPYGEVITPYTLGWDSSVKPDPYDPERAKALLAEAGYPKGFETVMGCTAGNRFWMEAIAANLGEVGIKAKINVYEGGAWWGAYQGKKLRGLIVRNSWYDAEPHAAADLTDAYMSNAPWCYYTTKEIEDALNKAQYAIEEKDVAAWGAKISKIIRESRINIHLWSNHSNYGVNQRILQWDRQMGSYPGTRFEYMKTKH
ncbi:MAG: ABC transporter substrate-binding protein [Deltaproteobacteria bacterium]|nr:ABC transporter substrate-binding protein [Deltaproteobacteria bacterium]MBW2053259.1 ABC transporter substrate-binding protein [Deltaproteobacteria bacterium]MBW2142348.1 ABC transporter substrate-binding protein [Deltaproteobacteria bacterium]MBW2324192.1 ABC transporter substrate-binding protein [Deltaproteobacteria bacterium]